MASTPPPPGNGMQAVASTPASHNVGGPGVPAGNTNAAANSNNGGTAAGTSTTAPSAPGSAHKRRPYEDPTDGERYQLYVHSRAHPELKQKDLVTWFAQNFGKEINQSTVSRALKRYRDNPPENPESAGMAKSKRGASSGAGGTNSPAPGGGGGAGGTGSNKRRRTTGGTATIAANSITAGAEGAEEEAARADEQVQRENQQGIGRSAAKTDSVPPPPEVHVLPYHQTPTRGRGAQQQQQQVQQHQHQPQQQQQQQQQHHHHHHHTLPPQQHPQVLPLPPPHQGPPQAQMHGPYPPPPPHNHVGNGHVNHINHPNHFNAAALVAGAVVAAAQAPSGPSQLDIDSDSDAEGIVDSNGNSLPNGSAGDEFTTSFTSDDFEIGNLHRKFESILLRNVLATGGAAAGLLPPNVEIPGMPGMESASAGAAGGDASAGAGQVGAGGDVGTDGSGNSHPTLSREALVMYLVGRNELVRSLQGRVAQSEREATRLLKKVQRRDEIIGKLRRGEPA